jgi:LPXTG-motif cell wall-anchored protein
MPRTGGVAPGHQSLLTLILVAGLGSVLAGAWFYRSRRRRISEAAT